MKAALSLLLGFAFLFAFVAGVGAEDKGEKKKGKVVTLKGDLVCAKCTLKLDGITKCTNAIKVTEDGKEVVYLVKDKGNKEKYHKGICAPDSSKKVTVKGTVTEKDGQKWITPAKEDGVKLE